MKIKISLAVCFLSLCFYIGLVYFSFDSKDLFKGTYSKVLLDKNKEILSVFLDSNEQWHLESEFIPQKLKSAVILYEDKNFYSHYGVDFLALIRAFKNNLFSSKRSGASTISMQTIKLLEQNKRTYFNKFNEIIKAFALESACEKDEILKLYLNNAPYGGNLVGVASAGLFYFEKDLKDLTWSEAALLAVLPNNPGLINLEKNKDRLLKKRNALLDRLFEKGYFSKDILTLAKAEKLPSFKTRKNLAPHLARRLLADKEQIVSSIDKKIQIKFEEKAKEYSYKLQQKGIKNLAILLADAKTNKVLAYVGSNDFYDFASFGQVDGVIAKRSVGSTLKPLLFAFAIDEGLIVPESLMLDVPTFFSNFAPQNANKKYHGFISAKESLQKSLNVPFVSLLAEYGYEKFFYKLKDILDFEDENFKKYGLSLILGTKEFSLEDMVKIYLGLGNYGNFKELLYEENAFIKKDKKLISDGASFLTLQTLKDLDRTGLRQYDFNTIISWKTGTSYGRKDAWAIGTSPKYTLGVWVGNFNGEANANLYGVSIAGELFFELLSLLEGINLEFEKPNDLVSIKIENQTGYRYDYKFDFKEVLYPQSANVLRTSPFLKEVFMYKNKEINSLDENFIHAKKKIILNLPSHAQAFFAKEKHNLPSFNQKLKIIYPLNNLNIILPKDLKSKQKLLVKISNPKKEKLFWYLNQELIFEGKEESLALNLKKGKYTINIISENGYNDFSTFNIF
ncbi:penicillin-binding protein 1C [Campylobacter lari]|uniref:penicillin-binding protein 1C n=2 Tax=Campylobacter lari TaxID=201 RepID=UPI00126C4751|nr:penicillin-binding protein 1C [Campylobacter lari]EAH7188113.1 penicillin-binding protein 1C [Campylobacter lari]EAI1582522.1 penicillin-binding protein 1C [Campylobacter lari]EAI3913028.1 penicillin-binding protein 1C [Campylobacter lari]EAI4483343.1 penicillin-binding protein 1C [Campylobacter lari]EAK0438551.1 penicillin-binding protein 1C [Campylobacter lari]